MPYSGGIFSRVYNWVSDKNNSIDITASRMDTEMDGMATGLSTCLLKDGTQTVTANIPMSGFKLTGLGAATAATDAVRLSQLQSNTGVWCGTSGGTANAQTLTPTPTISAYAAAQEFIFLPVATNTSGTVTIANSGLATRNVKKSIGGALVVLAVGDLVINIPARVVDDGTQYVLQNPQTYTHGADVASASTTVLDTVTGDLVDVTGTNAITAITLAEGRQVTVRFTGILTLTNGASLVLPGGANITTAAGDYAVFRGYATGVVRCISYTKASGLPTVVTITTQPAPYSADNYSFAASVGASALTIALKDRSGNDPSASSPVIISFRNATAATGDFTQLTITAATSLVVSSGSTLGTTNSVPFRAWIVGFNDAGTFRLGIVNCLSGTSIYPLRDDVLASSTAEGGAGGADSAQVIYTGSAVTTKAMRLLGYIEYSSGLGTAGTWASTPTKIQLFEPGVTLPGNIIQEARSADAAKATGTTAQVNDNTTPQNTEGDQFMSQAITPTSTANLLRVRHNGYYAGTAGSRVIASLFQDSNANALATAVAQISTGSVMTTLALEYAMRSATTSSTTFNLRAGGTSGTTTFNGEGGAALFNSTLASMLSITEIAA